MVYVYAGNHERGKGHPVTQVMRGGGCSMNKYIYRISRSILVGVLLTSCFFPAAVGAAVLKQEKVVHSVREKWGIEVTSLRMAVAGHMIDFRYRVLDSKKAATLFVRSNKPYLIDQASGKVLAVPNLGKVGPLRTSDVPQQGRIYWMFFGNGAGLVQPGSKVTVVIGDFRMENLVVQ